MTMGVFALVLTSFCKYGTLVLIRCTLGVIGMNRKIARIMATCLAGMLMVGLIGCTRKPGPSETTEETSAEAMTVEETTVSSNEGTKEEVTEKQEVTSMEETTEQQEETSIQETDAQQETTSAQETTKPQESATPQPTTQAPQQQRKHHSQQHRLRSQQHRRHRRAMLASLVRPMVSLASIRCILWRRI